jgi:hypothetical protein
MKCEVCGASRALDEKFCGSCGAKHPATDSSLASAADSAPAAAAPPSESASPRPTPAATDPTPSSPARSVVEALPAIDTGGLASQSNQEEEPDPGATSHAGESASRKSRPQALKQGIVLSGRYEIVRRIGGGGMGAVYLAKDHNLGDAPRAVKEMIQSHIDEGQHEKAIADFKR